MNVAMPVWDGRISPVFDAARWMVVIELEAGAEVCRREIFLAEDSPLERARRMAGMGVDALICGAISRLFVDLLKAFDIDVVPWVAGDADAVFSAYLSGKLPCPEFAMPGH